MYNVMIIDDEALLRQGIRCLVSWDDLDCTIVCEAENGLDATKWIDNNPGKVDIVVSDIKMPEMDGLCLAEYLSSHHPEIKIIILTAFADFTYAQKAIKYSVIDFVLKSNLSDTLPQAINKAKDLIKSEQAENMKLQSMAVAISESVLKEREKVLKDIFSGLPAQIWQDELFDSKLLEDVGEYYVVSYEITEKNSRFASGEMGNPTKNVSKKLLINPIKNVISMSLKNFDNTTVMITENHYASFVMVKEKINYTHELIKVCNDIISMLEGFMKAWVCIGISNRHSEHADIYAAYLEAMNALKSIFYTYDNISLYDKPINASFSDATGYTSNTGLVNKSPVSVHDFIDKLITGLSSGNLQQESEMLMQLFKEYTDCDESIEQAKITAILIYSSMTRLISEVDAKSIWDKAADKHFYRYIENAKSMRKIYEILNECIHAAIKLIQESQISHSMLIREVNQYIRENYSSQINLQIISDNFKVNSSYLSRLYRRETGVPLINAINIQRVEAAKRLLKNPVTKIFEIAQIVGIEEPAYFTHVFTKFTGISPKEYRNKL